jgi:mono/diheme cytochrome c family protein
MSVIYHSQSSYLMFITKTIIMKLRIFLSISILIVLFGCSQPGSKGTSNVTRNGTAWASGSFNSNGKQIYFTATSNRGTPISYQGGPTTGMMMGGNLACVSCHGTDARGGSHTMHMETMDAPDIRWSALSGGHHENEEMAARQEHQGGYDFDDFRNSVENGKHPDGDEVKKDMPRWQMNDADLKDLMNYLKTLD